MSLPNILLSLTKVINLSLAAVFFLRKSRSPINRSYAAFVLSVSFWAFTNAVFQAVDYKDTAYLWAILSYLAAIGIGASILYFPFVFPHDGLTKWGWKGRNYRKIIFWATLGVSVLEAVPGGVLKDVYLEPSGRGLITGPGLYLYAAYLISFFPLGASQSA